MKNLLATVWFKQKYLEAKTTILATEETLGDPGATRQFISGSAKC